MRKSSSSNLLPTPYDDRILEFVQVTGKIALNIPGAHVVYRLDDVDPDDNMPLAAAQAGGADYLVSLDAHNLLPMNHHKRTQIVDPALFIRALATERQQKSADDD